MSNRATGAAIGGALAGFVIGVAVGGSIPAVAGAFLGGVATQLVASDVDRNAAQLGAGLVRTAGLLLPRRCRREQVSEWIDDVLSAAEDGKGARPLIRATSILVSAPVVAIYLRRPAAVKSPDAPPEAEAISGVAAIAAAVPRFGMVGVFGPWGSGKSATLEHTRRLLPPSMAVAAFNAWSWEPLRPSEALLRAVKVALISQSALPWRHRLMASVRRPIANDDWSLRFQRLIRATRLERVVVTVDDLDRCDPEYAADLLETMSALREACSCARRNRNAQRPARVTFLVAADGPFRTDASSRRNPELDRHLLASRFDAIFATPR
jgi:KAP family P-loop domain